MIRLLIPCLLLGTAYAGTTASVTGNVKQDYESKDKKYSVGLSFAAFTKGFAYWTWNGYGRSEESDWFATTHGLDFSAGPIKTGPFLEYKIENQDKKLDLGLRASIKLW